MEQIYQYPSPSMCLYQEEKTVLGFSPDLSRDEKVSFVGKLTHPLIFRDAMLMLREIVIADLRVHKKERTEFFAWLNQEIERRLATSLPNVQESIKKQMQDIALEMQELDYFITENDTKLRALFAEIKTFDIWNNFNKIEGEFWNFIRDRDHALWMVLDPVITVHPDQVSFEAFSLDESIYGCLSVSMEEFDLTGKPEPQLGTTNIDFSVKLAREMERFRTYNNVELSINPEGFTVESGIMPEYLEKKINLPESWIKGFNQVSAAASLKGIEIELNPIDIYDICSFLKRNKAHKSPRYMEWILQPNRSIRVRFQPWGKELELSSIYNGKKAVIEKIWGRRRWLVLERLIPLSKSFKIKLIGFGMPQFIVADLGTMKMTIGFTSWTSNDWVRGTAFNIMAGFVGEGNPDVYPLLKMERYLSLEEINEKLRNTKLEANKAGLGILLRRGDVYYDLINDVYRYRQLCNVPLPKKFYEITEKERLVINLLPNPLEKFVLKLTYNGEKIVSYENVTTSYRRSRRYYSYDSYEIKTEYNVEITFDKDDRITKVNCGCREFKKGAKNISDPCAHILVLYLNYLKYAELDLIPEKAYSQEALEALK